MSQMNPVNIFLVEADELLAKIEEVVLDLQGREPQGEDINQLFRAFHTIKGSGAMFGFDAVADFTHHLENALDKVREGQLPLSEALLELILAAKDQIKALLDATKNEEPLPAKKSEDIIAAVSALCGGVSKESHPVSEAISEDARGAETTGSQKRWKVLFRPHARILDAGLNPALILRDLRELGECRIIAHSEDIPPLEAIKPEDCYLWWEVELLTEKNRNDIFDVFLFVDDRAEIVIEEVVPASATRIESSSTVTEKAPTDKEIISRPIKAETSAPTKASAKQDSGVRVPSEKLDLLVNLVGELVMSQSRLMQTASRFEAADLAVSVEAIERLVSELRDCVLGIRMMPIGATFSRFKRLVHDLSAELGKEVALITEGAETELDKTVLDKLGEPLVHLIRNSIDHGIESSGKRLESGKPQKGTIRLTAAHTGSNVVVTIQDDGRGIDPAVIRAKALEKHLISPDAILTDKETFNLIFLPGFSTAQQVTKVSGRGVGMDVVKRQIDALRGSVNICSKVGEGTTIYLTLPLTLAIIDGLLVEVGSDQYIVPMAVVMENVELHRDKRSLKNGRNVISVRGELIPYIRLREIFDAQEDEPEIERIVILRHEEQHIGLVVDKVLGSHQTVIQSLGRFYKDIALISGSTIMGDGRVALILDVPGLLNYVDQLNVTQACSR